MSSKIGIIARREKCANEKSETGNHWVCVFKIVAVWLATADDTNSCSAGLSPSSSTQINLSSPEFESLILPPAVLLTSAWLCSSKSSSCLPLRAVYICLLSVETKETDHKAYYGARSGIHAVCVHAPLGAGHTLRHTHTHEPSATLSPLPYLMWWQSHVFQASSSVNQNQTFIFKLF